MFYSCEKSIPRKNSVLSTGKFPSLVLPTNAIMLQHLIIRFPLYYLSSGRLREVKTKDHFKVLALKVVAVAYERWLLTRRSKYGDLT